MGIRVPSLQIVRDEAAQSSSSNALTRHGPGRSQSSLSWLHPTRALHTVYGIVQHYEHGKARFEPQIATLAFRPQAILEIVLLLAASGTEPMAQGGWMQAIVISIPHPVG